MNPFHQRGARDEVKDEAKDEAKDTNATEPPLPPGWFRGKLDNGTPFFYHEDNPADVVFDMPAAVPSGSL